MAEKMRDFLHGVKKETAHKFKWLYYPDCIFNPITLRNLSGEEKKAGMLLQIDCLESKKKES